MHTGSDEASAQVIMQNNSSMQLYAVRFEHIYRNNEIFPYVSTNSQIHVKSIHTI